MRDLRGHSFWDVALNVLPKNVVDKKYHIKFVTLKRRGKNILQKIKGITTWNKIRINKASRKYQLLKIHEEHITLRDYEGLIRQIVVTGTGRELPMRIVTNDFDTTAKEIIIIYALRWLIENNIQENVDFFSLNALSSPVIAKVDFDIAMTLIANTLYKTLSKKFKLFHNAKPKTIYRNVAEGSAKISISSDKIEVIFGKKAFNPLIMDWIRSLPKLRIPWMDDKLIEYLFE